MIYLRSVLLLFALFAAWISVQHLARRFSRRHPEFGPHRDPGCSGCGACGKSGPHCKNPSSEVHS